jgi:uncharacterized protein YbaP (TraB family)
MSKSNSAETKYIKRFFIMKQKLAWLLSLVLPFLACKGIAQNFQNGSSNANSLLWKISGKGLEKPTYLFGTIHAICSDDYFFTTPMQSALKSSQQLIMEIDISNPAIQAQMTESMRLQDGKLLRDYFDNNDEFAQFAQVVKETVEVDVTLFDNFKPFVLMSALAMKSFTCSNTSSYEMILAEKAKERNVPIIGLENVLSQAAIFDNMKKEEIKALLMASFQDREEDKKQQEEMIQLYKKQNINGLYNLILQSKEMKGHEDKLLIQRNENWVTQFAKLLVGKSSFIAVGAGHLAGEKGLIQLLRKAGYTVEPDL